MPCFLGFRPKSATEVFGNTVLRNGLMLRVAGAEVPVTVAILNSQVSWREVFLIPNSDEDIIHAGPRELAAEWDAIEDLPVPLLKIDSNGSVLASNREARSLLAISSTQGQRVGDILDGLGRPISDWVREAVEGRGGYVS